MSKLNDFIKEIRNIKDEVYEENRQTLLESIRENPENVRKIKAFTLGNRKDEYALKMDALRVNGLALAYMDFKAQSNMLMVYTACAQNGMALQYASGYLKDSRDIVMRAVEQNGEAVQFASNNMRMQKDVMCVAMETYPRAILYGGEVHQNHGWIKESNGQIVSDSIDEDIKKDVQIVKRAIEKQPNIILELSEEMQTNAEIARAAFQRDETLYMKLPLDVKLNATVSQEAVNVNPNISKFVPYETLGYISIPEIYNTNKDEYRLEYQKDKYMYDSVSHEAKELYSDGKNYYCVDYAAQAYSAVEFKENEYFVDHEYETAYKLNNYKWDQVDYKALEFEEKAYLNFSDSERIHYVPLVSPSKREAKKEPTKRELKEKTRAEKEAIKMAAKREKRIAKLNKEHEKKDRKLNTEKEKIMNQIKENPRFVKKLDDFITKNKINDYEAVKLKEKAIETNLGVINHLDFGKNIKVLSEIVENKAFSDEKKAFDILKQLDKEQASQVLDTVMYKNNFEYDRQTMIFGANGELKPLDGNTYYGDMINWCENAKEELDRVEFNPQEKPQPEIHASTIPNSYYYEAEAGYFQLYSDGNGGYLYDGGDGKLYKPDFTQSNSYYYDATTTNFFQLVYENGSFQWDNWKESNWQENLCYENMQSDYKQEKETVIRESLKNNIIDTSNLGYGDLWKDADEIVKNSIMKETGIGELDNNTPIIDDSTERGA